MAGKFAGHISRILVGLVFVFSGFVKAVDPAGSMLKISEYLEAAGLGLFQPAALAFGIVLSSLEFLIGIALVFSIRSREASLGALVFMILFTPLTLVLALLNPVSDCGCFGDALVLTNWQTFWKNFAILGLAVSAFVFRDRFRSWLPLLIEFPVTLLLAVFILSVSRYSFRHLPVIDFRPYHVGSYLPEKMKIPPGAPLPEYETILVYEKDGRKQEFSLDNYPWQDTSWVWVETRSVLTRKGYEPEINDFGILSARGTDITDSLFTNPGTVFFLVAPDLEKANRKALTEAYELSLYMAQQGYPFYVLTSSPENRIDQLRSSAGWFFQFLWADETALKTMIRSNPGLVAIHEGTVVAKWHYRDLPSPKDLRQGPLKHILNRQERSGTTLVVVCLGLGMLLFMAVLRLIFYQRS